MNSVADANKLCIELSRLQNILKTVNDFCRQNLELQEENPKDQFNRDSLCPFPDELLGADIMKVSHFVSLTDFWMCQENSTLRDKLSGMLL